MEAAQMLRLSCKKCGTVKTYAIPREDFIKNIMGGSNHD